MATSPIDWQLSCTEMKQRGHYLLQSGQWSDCIFLVGVEPHQISVMGHKLILAMASPVFEAMFFGGMAERSDPIPILDVQPEAFRALLEYIYTENINITSFDKACELCYGAKKYMLPHLVKECTRYLWSDLYPRNACRAYEFARLFEESVLMEKCIQIISTNTKEVLTDSSFEDVELNTMITVFSLDHLNVDSELDLFEAACRYAKSQEKRNPERSTSPSACNASRVKSPEPSTSKVVNVESSAENSPEVIVDPCKPGDADQSIEDNTISPQSDADKKPPGEQAIENKDKTKLTVRSAIENIRFLTLTPHQFAKGPARSPLLTESEAFAVLMNILSSNTDVPMPTGFSTCRVPRKQLIGEPSYGMPTFTVDTPSPVTVDQVFQDPPRANISHTRNRSEFSTSGGGCAVLALHMLHEAESPVAPRLYCHRPIMHHTDCLNTSVLDCSVTFMVDKPICLLGVQVPTQAPSEDSANVLQLAEMGGGSSASGYSELLYAHLLDADGARLTYTHFTSRVPYRHMLDIMFNRPVYLQRNKVYKVGIVFNKVGWYPVGTCSLQVSSNSIFFKFGIGQTSDSVRDGLIRSIIFVY